MDGVAVDGKYVCYDHLDVATKAPREVANATLFEEGDVSFIQFDIDGHGAHVTMSEDEDTWSDALPSHTPGDYDANTSSPYSLVNLRTPMTEVWYDKLTDNGTRVHHYFSHGWYLMDASNASTPPDEFAFVNRTTDFDPSTKLQEGLTLFDGTIPVVVRSMPGRPNGYPDSVQALQSINATIVQKHPSVNMTEANVSSTRLTELTEAPSVSRVEHGNYSAESYMDHIRETTGAQASHDVQSDIVTEGFTGQGITGMVMDLEHDKSNDRIEGSIAGYWPSKEAIQGDGPDPGEGIHGAKVFAIAHASDGPDVEREGMAPNGSSVIAQATPLSRIPAAQDLKDDYQGTIQVHSWGTFPEGLRERLGETPYPSWNTYDLRGVEGDLIGYEGDVLAVQAMGNLGPGRAAGEAIAKNGLSVGGLYHQDDFNRSNDSWSPDGADGGKASTGPTWDCRIKPDLVAPYDEIDTYGGGGTFAEFRGTSGSTPIVAGTAMLADQMYREGLFLNEDAEETSGRASPALLKALTINSAHSFTVDQTWDGKAISHPGCGPDADDPQPRHMRDIQGWGQPDLRGLLATGADTFTINETTRLDSGDRINYTVTMPGWVDGIRVTLAWTDPPGTPLANTQPLPDLTNPVLNNTVTNESVPRQLVNDLDLEVEAPNGTVFPGNRGLENASASEKGNREIDGDAVNTVEGVIANATDGLEEEWIVQVEANQIQLPHNPDQDGYGQPYALVIRPLNEEGSSGGGCCSSDDPSPTLDRTPLIPG